MLCVRKGDEVPPAIPLSLIWGHHCSMWFIQSFRLTDDFVGLGCRLS